MIINEWEIERYAEKIREIFEGNGIIVYPTETVYGIGGSPFSRTVKRKIMEMKKREDEKFIVLAESLELIKKIAFVKREEEIFFERFKDGGLTIVLQSRIGKTAFRLASTPTTKKLCKICGGFIVSTSANISGQPPAVSLEEIPEEIKTKSDILINGVIPPKMRGKPSTIIAIEGRVEILRIGAIPPEEIKKVAEEIWR